MPGAIVAGRFRIVSLLGAGGMGEVYRAEDTRLGQTVALKFLPEAVARDASRLERLHAEVRLGRQVTHPNVCRLHDVGEWAGHHFLSMEFVEGEDLARLLRRIGRLSPDKALELARGVCAGLAAAHARGVLHRDLKPANVMVDGQRAPRPRRRAERAGRVDRQAFVEPRPCAPAHARGHARPRRARARAAPSRRRRGGPVRPADDRLLLRDRRPARDAVRLPDRRHDDGGRDAGRRAGLRGGDAHVLRHVPGALPALAD